MKKLFFIIISFFFICFISSASGQVVSGLTIPQFNVDSFFIQKPDIKTNNFSKRVLQINKDANLLNKRDFYLSNDSVFVAYYFYDSDSTHPIRVGGGYVGGRSDFNSYFKSGVPIITIRK